MLLLPCTSGLCGCRDGAVGHSSGFWAWDPLPKARSPREQACSPAATAAQ